MAKVFSDRAKANAAMIEAQAAYAAAQLQASARLKATRGKIEGNLQQSMFDLRADRAREQAQSRDAANAGQEPEPMEPYPAVPLPDAAQPSQSLQGAGINIDPSQVSGGGGIQAATGGMGRAGPQSGDQGGFAVPPTITTQSQQTSQGTRPAPIGDSGFAGGYMQVPFNETNTVTNTRPNVLTQYQAGQLALAQARDRQTTVGKLTDDLATGYATALYGRQKGYVSPEKLEEIQQDVLIAAKAGGLGPRELAELQGRVGVKFGEVASGKEHELAKSAGDYMKTLNEWQDTKPGTPRYMHLTERLRRLETPTLGPLMSLLNTGTTIKMDRQFQNLGEARAIVKHQLGLVATHPEFFGARGTLMRAGTAALGAVSDVTELVGGKVMYENLLGSARSNLESTRKELMASGGFNKDENSAFGELYSSLNNQQLAGTLRQYEAALAVNAAAAVLDRTTMQGINSFKDNYFNFTGAKSTEDVRAQLKILQQRMDTQYENATIDYQRRGIPVPPYKELPGPYMGPRILHRSPEALPGMPMFEMPGAPATQGRR